MRGAEWRRRAGGSLKVWDERLQQYFQLPWKLFTAHKLSGRTLLSPSSQPSDGPPSWTDQTGFLFFVVERKKAESEMAFSFIPLFYYFHFLVFVLSFSLGGRRFITMVENNNKTQTQKVEDDLSPPSAPLSPFFSSILVPWWKEWEREKMRWEEEMKGNKQKRASLEPVCCMQTEWRWDRRLDVQSEKCLNI